MEGTGEVANLTALRTALGIPNTRFAGPSGITLMVESFAPADLAIGIPTML
jgi:hypothetical protein